MKWIIIFVFLIKFVFSKTYLIETVDKAGNNGEVGETEVDYSDYNHNHNHNHNNKEEADEVKDEVGETGDNHSDYNYAKVEKFVLISSIIYFHILR